MYIMNTFKLDKDYSKLRDDSPIKTMLPVEKYGLDIHFYGGRVDKIAELENTNILLLLNTRIDGIQVIDTAVKNLKLLTNDVLKGILKDKGNIIEDDKITKEMMINMLEPRLLEVTI